MPDSNDKQVLLKAKLQYQVKLINLEKKISSELEILRQNLIQKIDEIQKRDEKSSPDNE